MNVKFNGKDYNNALKLVFMANLGQYVGKQGFTQHAQDAIDEVVKNFGWKFSSTFKIKLLNNGYTIPTNSVPTVNPPSTNSSTQVKATVLNKKREFDAVVAKKYGQKYHNATKRGIEFDLSFTDFKKLLRATHCAYTGVLLTKNEDCTNVQPTDMTIERVDNSKGYIKGNCVVVCHAANMWKSLVLENSDPKIPKLSIDSIIHMLQTIKGHQNV